MRYPHFYDRFRDAIKNTWTVEEVDLHSDLADLAASSPTAERHLVVAPGRVLRHRRHDRGQQPGAEPLQARQLPRGAPLPVAPAVRGGRARPVLPDPARHLPPRRRPSGSQAFAAVENIPSIQAKARVLLQVDRLGRRAATGWRRASDRRALPAQPDLLRRRASRACSSTAPSPTSTSSAPAACCTAWPPARTGSSATSRCTWPSRSTSSTPCARRSPTCSTTSWQQQVTRRCCVEAVDAEAAVRRGPAAGRACRAVTARHARVPGVRRRPAAAAPRLPPIYGSAQPVRLHGAAGRAGAVQLLRAPRVGLPGRGERARSASTRTSSPDQPIAEGGSTRLRARTSTSRPAPPSSTSMREAWAPPAPGGRVLLHSHLWTPGARYGVRSRRPLP